MSAMKESEQLSIFKALPAPLHALILKVLLKTDINTKKLHPRIAPGMLKH